MMHQMANCLNIKRLFKSTFNTQSPIHPVGHSVLLCRYCSVLHSIVLFWWNDKSLNTLLVTSPPFYLNID